MENLEQIMSQKFILCAEIPRGENRWAGGNVPRGCNPEYDLLYAELVQIRIGTEREELARRLTTSWCRATYEIPLADRGLVSAHLNTLEGVRINAWDSEMWNIRGVGAGCGRELHGRHKFDHVLIMEGNYPLDDSMIT